MAKWEYRTNGPDHLFRSELNDLGAEGWELVAYAVTMTGGMFPTTEHYYIFKREIVAKPAGRPGRVASAAFRAISARSRHVR